MKQKTACQSGGFIQTSGANKVAEKYKLDEAQFLKEIAQHQMTVIRDDGVYRHIRFSRPQSSDMHFDIITWPKYLCYTGDMGTFVFLRLVDMFNFFREPDPERGLAINPGYWQQKVEAADKSDGVTEYCHDKFVAAINEWVDDYINDNLSDDPEKAAELREAVKDEVLSCDENEIRAHDAASSFSFEGFKFEDFWEVDVKKFSGRFIWCCFALVWAIQQYDASKLEKAA